MEHRDDQEVKVETYPESVRKLSENWRQLRPEERQALDGQEKVAGLSRYYLPIGVGIGVLVVAFLVVIGGLAFLVWNGGR
jgi:hypothetical protein